MCKTVKEWIMGKNTDFEDRGAGGSQYFGLW
jgi:hypothetical protein